MGAVRAEYVWAKDKNKYSKLEMIQDGATLIKHLGNPFGSTWIQKLITTKLRQKDLEHHLRCQAQDIELGVLEKREHSQA